MVAAITRARVSIASCHRPRLMVNSRPMTVNRATRQPARNQASAVRTATTASSGGPVRTFWIAVTNAPRTVFTTSNGPANALVTQSTKLVTH